MQRLEGRWERVAAREAQSSGREDELGTKRGSVGKSGKFEDEGDGRMRRGTSPMRKGPWTVAAPEQLGRGWQRAGVPNDSEGDRRCGEGNGEGVKRRESS